VARAALARRLLDHDILRPCPEPVASTAGMTVVVPARDRLAALERCLQSVRATVPESGLILVDDGSADAVGIRAACERVGATPIRRERSGGPAAARNTGLRASTTPFVAFVDSDAVLAPGWAEPLLGHFADASIGAVAPRVLGSPGTAGAIASYERRHSALDMGAAGGQVGPGRRVSYVPAVTLLVRRAAAGDGFDESLKIGEDVDFVWRLAAAGWGVRYDAGVHVWHEHRVTLASFVKRRREYAASTAALAIRHPGALPAVRLSPRTAAPWLLALLGRPRPAAAIVAWDVYVAARRLERVSDRPWLLATGLVARGLLGTGSGLAEAIRRAWLAPLLAIAIWRPRAWWLVLAAFLDVLVRDAPAAGSPATPASDAAIRLLNEVVMFGGTWEGCLRARTVAPLLPAWEGRSRS
jgi:mycofactocin system glycosyltransferase